MIERTYLPGTNFVGHLLKQRTVFTACFGIGVWSVVVYQRIGSVFNPAWSDHCFGRFQGCRILAYRFNWFEISKAIWH